VSRVSIMTDHCYDDRKDDRKAGIALIVGSVGGIFTMAIHPTGAISATPDQVAHLSLISGVAHSIALVSVLLLFLGACGLARRLAAADRISFAAIVTFGFACVAVMIAGAVSGFIVPGIMKHMIRDVPEAAHQWQIVIAGIFQMNRAFARIYSVGTSIAIILWSISALRNGGIARGTAIYGCVISPLLIVGIAIGHLRMDVHGMTAVMAGEVLWFILVWFQLCSRAAGGTSSLKVQASAPQ
jgi:hypothetical protein